MSLLLLFLSLQFLSGGECGVTVQESQTQAVLGKNIGFYVVFKNNSGKTVDAIQYKVSYLNGFDELMESKTYLWQATNLDKPIAPYGDKWDAKRAWIEGANKIKIKLIRIHYENGTSCWN